MGGTQNNRKKNPTKKKRGREIVVGRIIALKNAHVLIPRN